MNKFKKYISRFLAVLAAAIITAASVQAPPVMADDPDTVMQTEETAIGEGSFTEKPEEMSEEEISAPDRKETEPEETSEEESSSEELSEETEPDMKTEEEMAGEEKDIYETYDADLEILSGLDFSSMRLIVGASDEDIFADKDVVISSYNGVYLLQFEDPDTAKRAYMFYYDKADFVEADTGISIAEGEAAENVTTDTFMTEDDNPLDAITEVGNVGSFDIALIDTGADGADASVSMIGDYTGDDNGHGSVMLEYIAEQAPRARVLSIKALGADGRGDVSAVYAAIEYAISQNVRVINLSVSALASRDSTVIADAVNEAVSNGIVVVGAAGNNGRDAGYYIPGGIDAATVTGAAGRNGARLAKSNYGASVDYNIVAESTSEAAARLSGFIATNGIEAIEDELNKGFVFETDYESADDVNADTEYLGTYGRGDLTGEGTLYAVGIVRSTITLADRSVNTIDELWADNDGDGMFDNISAFGSTDTQYVVMYGTEHPSYFAARVADPDIWPSADYVEMIAAHDNDNGESVSGVIYDPATGIAYIPAGLIDFSGEQYKLNQIRIQTLYHTDMGTDDGTFTAAVNNDPYRYNQIDTGYGVYEVDKVPEVGSYTVITDADLEYAGGPYGGFYYDSDNRTYVADPGWVPSNSGITGLAENILTNIIDNISKLTFYRASNNGYFDSTSWEITLKSGKYTLSDGTTINIKGGTYDLTCNHIGINTSFEVDSTYVGAPYGNFDYDAYYSGVYFKILYRDSDYLYIGLVTASASTQAGAGIIKVAYQAEPKNGSMTFTVNREPKPGTVTVKKTVEGSDAARNRSFEFTYRLSGDGTNWGSAVGFTLKDGEVYSFSVPAGYYWEVNEKDYANDGFKGVRVSYDGGSTWTKGRMMKGVMSSDSSDSFPVYFATNAPKDKRTVKAVHTDGTEFTLTHDSTADLKAGTYIISDVPAGYKYRLRADDKPSWSHSCSGNVEVSGGYDTVVAVSSAQTTTAIGTLSYFWQPSAQGISGEYIFDNPEDEVSFTVKKRASGRQDAEQLKNNSMYSQDFSGAEFFVSINGGPAVTRTTGSDGTFQIEHLYKGDKLTITETKAPRGYALPAECTKTVTVSENEQENIAEFMDEPLLDPVGILLQKIIKTGSGETGTDKRTCYDMDDVQQCTH